jgi:hypothetical protein
MTVTNIDSVLEGRAPRRGEPQTLGQATAIEQSRAIAEVKAAVVVAQQCPRDVNAAVEMMRESCAHPALASRAFFRYSRGGSQITGPSIHLARELARLWGNIQYGIKELRRDDQAGESEMLADAWDVQTNTRSSSIFIVKHKRDTKNGQKDLTDLRDIYENNANQGARRVREAIFAVLPPWFIEEAKDLCMRTIEHGGGKPVATRIADAVNWFKGAHVRVAQIEEKLGRKRSEWEAADVAQLEVIARSIRNGETTTADEFPVQRASAEDFTAPAQPAQAQRPQAAQTADVPDGVDIDNDPVLPEDAS